MFCAPEFVDLFFQEVHGLFQGVLFRHAGGVGLELDRLKLCVVLDDQSLLVLDVVLGLLEEGLVLLELCPQHVDRQVVHGDLVGLQLGAVIVQQGRVELEYDWLRRRGLVSVNELGILLPGLDAVDARLDLRLDVLTLGAGHVGAPVYVLNTASRAGHLRYFFIVSTRKNDILHFLSSYLTGSGLFK